MKVTVVGRGKVGRGLVRGARRAGMDVRSTAGRDPKRRALRGAELVVLAVPDGAIAEAGDAVAPHLEAGAAVVHCAGARGVDELAACARAGLATGAMHPMVSFASPDRPPDLEGTVFVIAGSEEAIRAARRFARGLGTRPVVAEVHGAAYHAVAALVANGAAALVAAGLPVLHDLGLGEEDARHTLGALLRTVAQNVESLGLPDALTGPVARGDAETVARHRHAIAAHEAALLAYDGVAPAVLACAVAAGLPEARARAVAEALAAQARMK